jgi:uncharacterized protein
MTEPKAALSRYEIFRVLRENRDLLDRYGARRIGLFGSHARGDQTDRSDVDLVVEFAQPTYDNFIGLTRALEDLFGRRVEILTPDGLDSIRVPKIAADIRKALTFV